MTDWHTIEATHGASLRRVVASYAPPGPHRDELAQDVALAVWRAMPRFRGDASLRTYVLRIAHNVGLRYAMRRRATWGEPFEEVPSTAPSPEDDVVRRDRSRQLMAAIRTLPIGQRQALTLALEGLSHAEIGDVLGVRENAIAVRLHRARARLTTLLKETS